MKIWALFSVSCDYDQPPNNLEAWWVNKPDKKQLRAVIYPEQKEFNEENSVAMEKLLNGGSLSIEYVVDYRLEQLEEGAV